MAMTFILAHDTARKNVCEYALKAAEGTVVKFMEARRSCDQNAKYHVMIQEIADQFLFCNRRWDADDMKRLLIDQFKRDTITDPELKDLWIDLGKTEMAPSIDGTGFVMLGTQSRRFQKPLAAAFIEWLAAFGAQQGVRFTYE